MNSCTVIPRMIATTKAMNAIGSRVAFWMGLCRPPVRK